MEPQGLKIDLDLSLDDFIPPHLQKRSPAQNHLDDAHWMLPPTRTPELPPEEDPWDSPGGRKERFWIRYNGIGPTDENGMPFASRSSVDKPREWYKNMFRVLHRQTDSDDSDKEDDDLRHPNQKTETPASPSKSGVLENPQPKHYKLKGMSLSASPTPKEPEQSLTRTSASPQSTLTHNLKGHNPPPSKTSNTSHLYATGSSPRRGSTEYRLNGSPSSKRSDRTLGSSYSVSKSSSSTFPMERSPVLTNGTNGPPRQPEEAPGLVQNVSPLKDTSSSGSEEQHHHKHGFTSKVLEQLETEIREFTEELDRDLRVQTETSENLLHADAPTYRTSPRPVSPADGGHEADPPNKAPAKGQTQLREIARAVAKFDFQAESPKELSLQRGGAVSILKRVDKNWLLGEHAGQRGLFPDSYVKVLPPGQAAPNPTSQMSGVALYDFKADSDAELSLCKGQRVLITRRVGGNWFEGRVEGSERLALFPASYVQVGGETMQEIKGLPKTGGTPAEQVPGNKSNPEASEPVKLCDPAGAVYRVLFDFSPKNFDELELITGDTVTVTQRCDDGWYVGVCWRTQKFGTFPGNFVVPAKSSADPMLALKRIL
ncbi:vinexin isoform X2 [Spea bombifrons]|nr:vinexin isoform X2 [Spea bombifrons]XP_053319026.1 vinexin isoform X2 [Spea bombifrons]XP_053319027.1 vinexin isoform X2 [Spea bombifrons]